MICPKCQDSMRTYERNGINVDQCNGCRGIFLDYGELEHITQMESRTQAPPVPQPPVHQYQQPVHQQPQYGYGHGNYGHRRKNGFGGLFFGSS